MAESLDDGEFWLPPQFLTDDDILVDMAKSGNKKTGGNKEGFDLETEATTISLFPFEFPYEFGAFAHSSSDLSSPVESVVGSNESESDEEDFIAGLTRRVAHSTLDDDTLAAEKTKARFVSGSPQSTLCSVGRGCGCRQGSSRGSPNCQSQVSSPPGTWDLLYAAAGEVARMRMNEESYRYQHSRGLLGPPRKPSPISVPLKNHNPNLFDAAGSIYSHKQSLSHQKLQAAQFQQLKQQQQQQMMKQNQASSVWGGPQQTQSKPNGQYQVGGMNRVTRSNNPNSGRPLALSPSAWPPLQHATTQQPPQQQNGSGMRAVFLGAPNVKRESVGTGVFLPRRVNIPTEPRKKSACSTVLLPAKVVQALNLNFDNKGTPFHPRFGSYMPECDTAAVRTRNSSNGVSAYQKRNLRQQQAVSPEIRLPQEWTY